MNQIDDESNPWHAPETLSPRDSSQKKTRLVTCGGCLIACLVSGFVVFVLLHIFGLGIGQPVTYWHRLGDAQVFEGPDRVVVFIEIERAMQWPGFMDRPPHNYPAAFLRIDVFPDGRVERSELGSDLEGHITFNTNLYAIVRLADGFYLVENPSYAPKPAYSLTAKQIERLTPEEGARATGNDLLRTSDSMFDLSKLDAISAKRGWRRLNHEPGGGPYLLIADPVDSTRHGVRLRHVGGMFDVDAPESIVAESLSANKQWNQRLIEVDTRRWKARRNPSDRAYLRERYAASPAR